MPDPEELLLGPTRALGQDPTLLDWGTSQVLPASFAGSRDDRDQTLQLEEDDLGLDLGDDFVSPAPQDRSIEVGRRAETARSEMRDESMLYQDDLGLDLGLDEPTILAPQDDSTILPLHDDDIPMVGMDDFNLALDNTDLSEVPRAVDQQARQRDSASPLSSIRSSVERELQQTFQLDQQSEVQADDETMVQAQLRTKRRKVLQADVNTELPNAQIRAQQEDRSKITKAPTFLPRDPMLLALMNMQKSGGFVSNILGDGRSMGWAPELRGVLSLEVVRRAGELKRKRDSGVVALEIPAADEESVIGAETTPAPEEEQELELGGDDFAPLPSPGPSVVHAEAEPVMAAEELEEEDNYVASPGPAFDETTMPLLHPADSGPVSLGTKHAVHMLRERFSSNSGTDEMPSPRSRANQSIIFTDMCPEARTSRQDATKMFFEILVLGTKDAVKVEQSADELGAPLRIRGKRGLWGDWAEMGVSTQSQGASQAAGLVLEADEDAAAIAGA